MEKKKQMNKKKRRMMIKRLNRMMKRRMMKMKKMTKMKKRKKRMNMSALAIQLSGVSANCVSFSFVRQLMLI